MVVIVEEMPHVESAAYDLLIPGGILTDDPDKIGSSHILAELTSRGAGSLDARGISDAFDDLGARHSESAGHDRFLYHGSLLADTLRPALELVSKMVLRPTFPEEEINPIKSVFLQDIASLVDHPSRRAMIELASRYYPAPYNRPGMGSESGISGTSRDDIRKIWERCFRGKGSILSVAGKVSAKEVVKMAEDYFSAWGGESVTLPAFGTLPGKVQHHIPFESSQEQIVMAYPSAPFGDRDYYVAKLASGILSGGMFGRLFIEVREKRGLCYSVYARHSSNCDYGTVSVYAGTTPERAHETLSVILQELSGLRGTISEEELERAKANLKAALIIGEEAPGSRSSSNAGDWWLQRKVRTLEEIQAEISAVTIDRIDSYLERFPCSNYSLLTLGARDLRESPESIEVAGAGK